MQIRPAYGGSRDFNYHVLWLGDIRDGHVLDLDGIFALPGESTHGGAVGAGLVLVGSAGCTGQTEGRGTRAVGLGVNDRRWGIQVVAI